MTLMTRQGKGSKLSIVEMDDNLIYLESLSGLTTTITGSTEGEMIYWNDSTKKWSIAETGITWDETNNYINLPAIQFDTTNIPAAHNEGLFHWDDDSGTIEIGMKGGNVRLQLGLETLLRARNITGEDIPNGTPVYINGVSGNSPTIGIANSSIHIVANSTLAVATEDISNNSFGYSTVMGCVNEIDTSNFIIGRPVFLDVVSGLTQTLPTAPNSKVFVGVVIVSSETVGKIFVKIINQPNLDELSNVHISGVTSGQSLTWDGSRWVNSSLSTPSVVYAFGTGSTSFTTYTTSITVPFTQEVIPGGYWCFSRPLCTVPNCNPYFIAANINITFYSDDGITDTFDVAMGTDATDGSDYFSPKDYPGAPGGNSIFYYNNVTLTGTSPVTLLRSQPNSNNSIYGDGNPINFYLNLGDNWTTGCTLSYSGEVSILWSIF